MRNANLQTYYDQLKNHYLEPLELGQHLQAYYLREKPGSRMMSCLIIFSPEGIIITGDLNPGRRERKNGIVARGYDMGWFSRPLEPTYLAEKFLTEVWVPASFKQYVEEYIAGSLEEGTMDKTLRPWRVGHHEEQEWTEEHALKYLISHSELIESPYTVWDNLPACRKKGWGGIVNWECPYDSDFMGTGYDYDPIELGWLSAIQRRFSELIGQLEAVKA